jgi:transcriptional regulator with XRE-family HTH domain
VRELRKQRGLTLKALGRRAALSHPFLSQLERGLARPSVESVERIAHALDVPVGALWRSPRTSPPALVRAGEEYAGGLRRLSPRGEPIELHEWSGDGGGWPDETETRHGATAVYVIRGALEIDVEGEVFALDEGDALHFDGAAPHRFRRTGDPGTRALYVAAS